MRQIRAHRLPLVAPVAGAEEALVESANKEPTRVVWVDCQAHRPDTGQDGGGLPPFAVGGGKTEHVIAGGEVAAQHSRRSFRAVCIVAAIIGGYGLTRT